MRVPLVVLVVALAGLCSAAQDTSSPAGGEPEGIKQPIEFDHRLHVTELKQPCKVCHADTGPGELVDMPDTGKCLSCHSSIAPHTTAEAKLAAFAKQNRPIDWVRLYQIPTFVRFNHRQHTAAHVACTTCHGQVELRKTLARERDLSMGTCVTCHREMGASLDCESCHEAR